MLQLAAHVSRAITLTEWLDPSIRNELDPDDRDMELDPYDPKNPNQPPYTDEYLVPVLVIENSADDGCRPSHAARIYAGVQHDDKELHFVKGATHYYIGQPEKMAEAVAIVAGWLKKKKRLD